jgi:predicted metal-binding membrane protein
VTTATTSPLRAEPLPRLRAGLIAALVVLAGVGWTATSLRMRGMDDGPGTDPGALGFWVMSWVVMMAAMMFPSIAPMVVAHANIQRLRRQKGHDAPVAASIAFVAGYLISWTAFGLATYAAYSLALAANPGFLAWDRGGRYAVAAVVVAAAIYQMTPAKDVCLRKCRGPLDFVLGAWRDGVGGSLRMGVEHGAWCVGCCWALMAALVALGVMNVGVMVFVAALIAVEKLSPWRSLANRGVAVVLLCLGLAVAVAPGAVPGLTEPGSMDEHMGSSQPSSMGSDAGHDGMPMGE